MTTPVCGAQQPGTVPSPFDWWLLAAVVAAGGALKYVYSNGVPVIGTAPGVISAAAFAGAAAIVVLVAWYALQPDGCIRSPKNYGAICFGGLVETTVDTSSDAADWIAPFAIPPLGFFDVVVKSMYWQYVTQNAWWVNCSARGAAMLRCVVKDDSACAAKIGSLIGVVAGAVLGIIVGVAAAAAIGCVATGPFYPLCLLLAIIVAAIVAAAIAYAGAVLGGWAGEAASGPGSRTAGDFKALRPGAIVTIRGDWVIDPDKGYSELLYTTFIGRNGDFPTPPSYSTADADSTPAADCEDIVLQ